MRNCNTLYTSWTRLKSSKITKSDLTSTVNPLTHIIICSTHPRAHTPTNVMPVSLQSISEGSIFLQYSCRLRQTHENYDCTLLRQRVTLDLQETAVKTRRMNRHSIFHPTPLTNTKNAAHSILVMTYHPDDNSGKQIVTNNCPYSGNLNQTLLIFHRKPVTA